MPIGAGGIAAIGASADVASSVGSGIFGAIHAKKANERNIENWHMANAYNHPSQQMARLQEAGLNPNMIYGTSPSSAVGQSNNVAQAPKAQANIGIKNPMTNLLLHQDIRQRKVQTNNLRAQHAVIAQEANLKAAQVAQLGISTARGKFDLNLARELRQTSIDAAMEQVRKTRAEATGHELSNEIKHTGKQHLIDEIRLRVENLNATLSGTKLSNAIKQEQLELMKLGIYPNDPIWGRIFVKGEDKIRNVADRVSNFYYDHKLKR
ncbi:DNA pilot protein [Microviridae sp.]|nr:DNA pilot protein [Microviridae sp.]